MLFPNYMQKIIIRCVKKTGKYLRYDSCSLFAWQLIQRFASRCHISPQVEMDRPVLDLISCFGEYLEFDA